MNLLNKQDELEISKKVINSRPEAKGWYDAEIQLYYWKKGIATAIFVFVMWLLMEKCTAQTSNSWKQDYKVSLQQGRVEYFEQFHPVATLAGYEYDIDPMFLLDSGFKLKASLGRRINNHFGIKCYRKDCPKGHCENYSTETSHKDFFIKYCNEGDSFFIFAKMCRNWMNTNKKTCEYEFFKYYINCYYP